MFSERLTAKVDACVQAIVHESNQVDGGQVEDSRRGRITWRHLWGVAGHENDIVNAIGPVAH